MSDDTQPPNRLCFAAWCWHFYARLYVVPFLIMLAVTGLIMLWVSSMTELNGERARIVPGTELLPVSALQGAAEAAVPGGTATLHIDQFTGNVLADVRYADYSVYSEMMAWGIAFHGGDLGAWNLALYTAFCLAVILMSVSGIVMWVRRPPAEARLGAQPPTCRHSLCQRRTAHHARPVADLPDARPCPSGRHHAGPSDPLCRPAADAAGQLMPPTPSLDGAPTMTRILAFAVALFLALPAAAHEIVAGDLQIIHPHIPQPFASAKTAGGYMAIVNSGAESDRLIGIGSDISMKSMVHESRVDADGVGTMAHVDAIEIPPGATVSLEPGGYHIMFMGLTGPLTEGEMHKVTLIFERAGRVEVEFQIDPPAGQDGMDHSAMGHGTGG